MTADMAQLMLDNLIDSRGGLANFSEAQITIARVYVRQQLNLLQAAPAECARISAAMMSMENQLPPAPIRVEELKPWPYRITPDMSLIEAERCYQRAISDTVPYAYDGPALDTLLAEVRRESTELADILDRLKGSASLRERLAEALTGEAAPARQPPIDLRAAPTPARASPVRVIEPPLAPARCLRPSSPPTSPRRRRATTLPWCRRPARSISTQDWPPSRGSCTCRYGGTHDHVPFVASPQLETCR
jgi:hypothetical protein